MAIPKKVEQRIVASLKRFQSLLSSAKARDVNESDTVMLITDMLSSMFGYDRYEEITTEYSIRGTYCDLAIKINGKLQLLIECKAIGLELKDHYIKQAVDYAANEGLEWVILTNGITWQVYKIAFGKPIRSDRVFQVDILAANPKDSRDIDLLYVLSKEGILGASLPEYDIQRQTISKHNIAAIVLGDQVIQVIRRELRRLNSDAKIQAEDIDRVLRDEVIKRELIEGDKADEARKKVSKSSKTALRTIEKKEEASATEPDPESDQTDPVPPDPATPSSAESNA